MLAEISKKCQCANQCEVCWNKKRTTMWTNYCNKLIYDAVVRVTMMCDCVFIPPGTSVKSMFMCSFRKKTNCIQYAQTVPLTEPNPMKISMDNTQHLQYVILHLQEKKLYQIQAKQLLASEIQSVGWLQYWIQKKTTEQKRKDATCFSCFVSSLSTGSTLAPNLITI